MVIYFNMFSVTLKMLDSLTSNRNIDEFRCVVQHITFRQKVLKSRVKFLSDFDCEGFHAQSQ